MLLGFYINFTGFDLFAILILPGTVRRLYYGIWEENRSPWNQSLCYDASNGRKGGLPTHMTCPTSWFVLNALGGTSIDVPNGRLYLSPRMTTAQTELHIPVYLSRFWGWLDYVPATKKLPLRIDKVFAPDAAAPRKVAKLVLDSSKYPGDYPAGYRLESSVDGQTWSRITEATEQETTATVRDGGLTIPFALVDARYLRVTSIGSHGLWWSVREMSVYGP